ncbi:hypothetical protein CR51_33510 [Caballeronia megalochromosomata]|nr:hypothetical protein CR51_33510 [Caballeronia megalochromosomata]
MACVDEAGYVESKLEATKMQRPLCGVKQRLQAAVEFAKLGVRSCKMRANCVFCLIETLDVIAANAAPAGTQQVQG